MLVALIIFVAVAVGASIGGVVGGFKLRNTEKQCRRNDAKQKELHITNNKLNKCIQDLTEALIADERVIQEQKDDLAQIKKTLQCALVRNEIDDENVAALHAQRDELIKVIAAKKTEIEKLDSAIAEKTYQNEELLSKYNDLMASAAAMHNEVRQASIAVAAIRNEHRAEGSVCDVAAKDQRLIDLVDEIIAAYPDKELSAALHKFVGSRVWLPRMQTICRENGVFDRVTRGIYLLTLRTQPDIHYVGQAVDIKERGYSHAKSMIGVTNSSGSKLYDGGYVPSDFIGTVIERDEDGVSIDLNARERYGIEFYDCVANGLNSKSGNN